MSDEKKNQYQLNFGLTKFWFIPIQMRKTTTTRYEFICELFCLNHSSRDIQYSTIIRNDVSLVMRWCPLKTNKLLSLMSTKKLTKQRNFLWIWYASMTIYKDMHILLHTKLVSYNFQNSMPQKSLEQSPKPKVTVVKFVEIWVHLQNSFFLFLFFVFWYFFLILYINTITAAQEIFFRQWSL